MSNFTPKPGDPCLLNGAKVTYVGRSLMGITHMCLKENEKGNAYSALIPLNFLKRLTVIMKLLLTYALRKFR